MRPRPPKRVAIAITSSDGNTLCGFRTTAAPSEAGRLFASSVRRLRRVGHREAPVVVSIEANQKNYGSLWEAERGLDQALDLVSANRMTRECVRQP